MADFTFDVNALMGIQRAGETLLKEQDEVNAARTAHDTVVARLAAEKVKLAAGTQQVIMDGAARAKAHLDTIDANLARVNEINDSWMLRAIEPIAQTIGMKNFSRGHLVQDIRTEEAALDSAVKRSDFELTTLRAKNTEIDAKVEASAAKLAMETGDVTSLASSMEILKDLRLNADAAREGLILNTETEEIGKLAEAGIISPRRAEKELQLRTSEKRRAQSEAITAALQNFQLEEAKIQRLTLEDLRDPNKIKGFSPSYVQAEIQRKSQQQMAWQNSALALQATQRAAAAETLTNDQLTAAGAAGDAGLTPYAAKEEVKRRESEAAKQQEQINLWKMRAEAAKQTAAMGIVSASTIGELRAARDAGAETGIAVFTGPNGEKIEVSTKLVADELKLKESVQVERAMAVAGTESATVGLTASFDEMERAIGIDAGITKGAPLADRLTFLMEQNDLDAETRASMSIVGAKMKAAESGSLSAQDSLALQRDALAIMQKAQQKVRKNLMDSTGSANQPGVSEYIRTGKIEKAETALPIVATAVISGESTGNPLYDQGLKILSDKISGAAAAAQADSKSSAISLIDKMAAKDLDPAELASASLVNPAMQAEMAMPIIASIVTEAHTAAMDAVGLKDVAASIRSGRFYKDKPFSEVDVMAQLEQNKINVDEYMAHLREASRTAAQRITASTGKGGAAIASLNKLYFHNQPEAYAEDRTMAWFRAAITGVNATNTFAKTITDPTSQFGL